MHIHRPDIAAIGLDRHSRPRRGITDIDIAILAILVQIERITKATAVEAGIAVVCVDADVPASKRLAFVGTDWYDLGIRQAEAMVKALAGKKGRVALLGLIDQVIDQNAFNGFRSVAEKAGLTCAEPQHDKGNQAEAGRLIRGLNQ